MTQRFTRLASRIRKENEEREDRLVDTIERNRALQTFLAEQIDWLDAISLLEKDSSGCDKVVTRIQGLLNKATQKGH